MDWSPAVCTGLLEVPGILFYQFHCLGDLQSFVKGEIPFSQEALLNLSFSQTTHNMSSKDTPSSQILKVSVTMRTCSGLTRLL